MGILRRLFGLDGTPPPRVKDLAKRLDELEDDVEHLAHQFRRLKGRVTGGLRRERVEEPTDQVPAVEQDPPGMPTGLDPVSRRIWLRRLNVVSSRPLQG